MKDCMIVAEASKRWAQRPPHTIVKGVFIGAAFRNIWYEGSAFYGSTLGTSPESFDSQMMKTDDFSGEKDGWSYSMYVASMKAGGNASFHISMQK